jgi:MoxR-like ATPase
MSSGLTAINDRIREESAFIAPLKAEIAKVIIGQHALVDRLLIGLLGNGHVLLEGLPGLAKTLSVKTLSAALSTQFQRIQFTPDLLPADLVGTQIYNPKEGSFSHPAGPPVRQHHSGGRSEPRARQSAKRPAGSHAGTAGDHRAGNLRRCPIRSWSWPPRIPIEQEGTYPLPEAQVDRFMLKVHVGYPNREEERRILDAMATTGRTWPVKAVVEPATILRARQAVDEIYVDDKIKEYILNIIFATREPETFKLDIKPYLRYGASPRATIFLTLAAKAHAFLNGRGYVTPQDVKNMAPDVLRHRVLVSYEAEAEELRSDDLIARILNALPVP